MLLKANAEEIGAVAALSPEVKFAHNSDNDIFLFEKCLSPTFRLKIPAAENVAHGPKYMNISIC